MKKEKQEMDLYDFDNTMLPLDSGSRFWLFCLIRYPWIALCLPIQALAAALFFWNMTLLKRYFFCFVAFIPLKKAVTRFWDAYEPSIHPWARKGQRKRFTVVISASPDFLLEEIAERLEIDVLLCTKHSRKTGRVKGLNCREQEKVRRFYERFSAESVEVETVYSDSLRHDKPLFSLGKHCVHVVDGERIPFAYDEQYKSA